MKEGNKNKSVNLKEIILDKFFYSYNIEFMPRLSESSEERLRQGEKKLAPGKFFDSYEIIYQGGGNYPYFRVMCPILGFFLFLKKINES